MSSCVVIQQNSNVFVASDTAISANIFNKRYRLEGSVNKVFRKNDDIVFCSGNLETATKCRAYIDKMNNIDIEEMQKVASLLYIDGMFEIFIVKNDNGCVKSYQLSSYNNFTPIERIVDKGMTEIYALGFNTVSMLNTLEAEIRATDVLSAIQNTFNKNVCVEVGGGVDILYFHNGYLQEKSYKLKDNTIALPISIKQSDCELVIADTLIGNMVLSKELYVSNENVSFKIEGDGLKVKDTYGTEKIFMGLTDQAPHFRVGQTNGYYLEWKDNNLTINASTIKLGSQQVATGNDVNNAVNGAIQNVQAGFELKYNEIRSYIDDKANLIQAGVDVKVGQVRTYVDDRANNLQASINVQAGLISQKVSKGEVISQINQSAEQIQISANRISLEGAVSIGTGGRKVKIDNADYTVLDGDTRKGFFGFRSVSYDNYVIPRFSMGNSGTSGANEYFAINPYKGNGENPQNYKYSYVDIAYHSMQYNTSSGGDWSNIKMYADGVMRLSPIKKLEVTSNFAKGSYGGAGERLVAEFRTDNHTWYNGNISTGAIVNRTNGNGLILIDQHDHLGRQAGVRVQCNDDGGKSFRALDDGGTYCGTSNYRWKAIYSVKGTISTSDERYKIKTGELDTQDCYDMVKNIPLYNYYMMNKKVEELTEEEINEQMSQDNAQIGLMAQDLQDYDCGKAILDYDEETDIYNVKQVQLNQALLGALQKQIEMTEQMQQTINIMKQEIENLKEKQNGSR